MVRLIITLIFCSFCGAHDITCNNVYDNEGKRIGTICGQIID